MKRVIFLAIFATAFSFSAFSQKEITMKPGETAIVKTIPCIDTPWSNDFSKPIPPATQPVWKQLTPPKKDRIVYLKGQPSVSNTNSNNVTFVNISVTNPEPKVQEVVVKETRPYGYFYDNGNNFLVPLLLLLIVGGLIAWWIYHNRQQSNNIPPAGSASITHNHTHTHTHVFPSSKSTNNEYPKSVAPAIDMDKVYEQTKGTNATVVVKPNGEVQITHPPVKEEKPKEQQQQQQ